MNREMNREMTQYIDDLLKELKLIDMLLNHFNWTKKVTLTKSIAGILYQFGRHECPQCLDYYRGEYCEACDEDITKHLDSVMRDMLK